MDVKCNYKLIHCPVMDYRITSNNSPYPNNRPPKVVYKFFSSLSGITLIIEMEHHFNYRST